MAKTDKNIPDLNAGIQGTFCLGAATRVSLGAELARKNIYKKLLRTNQTVQI